MTQRNAAHSLPACALLSALLAVCAQLQLPLPGVPVSLALFAVHLGGMLLGARRAFFASLAYLLLGLCGLPVFSGFASGPAALIGPTGGFLLAYPLCAALTGALSRRHGGSFASLCLCALPGNALCMALGVGLFMLVTHTPPSPPFFAYWLIYLPGDLIKIILAALLAIRLKKPFKWMGI